MYIAMNRFKIKPGREQRFITFWKNRDSHLEGVPGFRSFNLLQGPFTEDYTLFVSHSMWDSQQDFVNWTKSESFRKAHEGAREKAQDIYLEPPELEGFGTVL